MITSTSSRILRRLALALGAVGLVVSSSGAAAAPSVIPDTAIDLELRETDVADVFMGLGEASGQKFTLDPCVAGKVDMKLENAPLPLVFDLLAAKLDLHYEARDRGVRVGCGRAAPARTDALAHRVSIEVRDAALGDVLDQLANSAGLAGASSSAPGDRQVEEPRISLMLPSARLSTALDAIADQTGARVSVEGDRIVAVY